MSTSVLYKQHISSQWRNLKVLGKNQAGPPIIGTGLATQNRQPGVCFPFYDLWANAPFTCMLTRQFLCRGGHKYLPSVWPLWSIYWDQILLVIILQAMTLRALLSWLSYFSLLHATFSDFTTRKREATVSQPYWDVGGVAMESCNLKNSYDLFLGS